MSTNNVIKKAVTLAFTQRIAYMALRFAQKVAEESPDTPNHDVRMIYADQVFRGEDKALLLTLHVVAAAPGIATALDSDDSTIEDVNDADIEAGLEAIWDSRSIAYSVVNMNLRKAEEIVIETMRVAGEVKVALDEIRFVAGQLLEKQAAERAQLP